MIDRVYFHLAFILLVSMRIVIAQEEAGPSRVEIGRGSCGSQMYYAYVYTCAIPSATPAMNLSVSVLRQFSRFQCKAGKTFGVAADNSYLWVSSGCQAEFSISDVTPRKETTTAPSATPTQTSATSTIVTTTSPATTTTMPTTSPPPPTAVTTTSPPPTTTTITTASPRTTLPTAGRSNAAFCGQVDSRSYRIIGGTDADTCEFPWMVLIYDQLKNSLCGASIIDNTHVATAAHCFFSKNERTNVVRKSRANELLVFSGSSNMPFSGTDVDGLVRRVVTEVLTHENYNHTSLENDIAILKLSIPIQYDDCHKPICMVDGSKTPHEASNCRAMGWGITSNAQDAQASSKLQYVDVPVVSDSACRAVYGSMSTSKTFCAGSEGRDSCQGDSGGPLICPEADGKNYLYGIVSAGIGGRCGSLVGIYTKVFAFNDWINSKLQ